MFPVIGCHNGNWIHSTSKDDDGGYFLSSVVFGAFSTTLLIFFPLWLLHLIGEVMAT